MEIFGGTTLIGVISVISFSQENVVNIKAKIKVIIETSFLKLDILSDLITIILVLVISVGAIDIVNEESIEIRNRHF